MVVRSMIADLKRTIHIEGASTSTLAQKMFVLLFSYGLHTVLVYRINQLIRCYLSKWWTIPLYYPAMFIYHCLSFACAKMYGIHIDSNAEIESGFYIGHFGRITIGSDVLIGRNCSVHQQVSIGILPIDKVGKVEIKDNVWIGGHSSIFKGVFIGENATVVVGSCVMSDVKPFSMVMGNPARLIKMNYDNSSLMGH